MSTTTHKKRMTKHELKEDQFVVFAYRTRDAIEKYKTGILFAVLGVIGVIAVVTLYQRSATSGSARAEQILFLAMNDYELGRFQEAANGLTQFVDRYPRHKKVAVAKVALGNAHLTLGQPAEAERRFREGVGSASKGSDLWVAATMGLGLAAEAQGSFDAALASFREVVDSATSKEAAAEALANAIRLKVRAGDRPGAFEMLKKAETEYGTTRAARRFSELKGTLEASP